MSARHKVLAQELAAQELEELPDRLRGQMYRLIERLEAEGQLKMPHSRVIGSGLFKLWVGGTNIARTLYCYAQEKNNLEKNPLGAGLKMLERYAKSHGKIGYFILIR
ncbi:type II toxin-antitoxin system RelE/ParE family toxin [Pantoea sp. FN0305]|uniref:type II toxin-antitoxin system RelE/ParE family toxin n=1 Tax=Pantoea sp. FN0305 TaxID=3418559 RepID=UPI003CF09498